MVTLSNANSALKTYYLGVLANQLNVGINPFLAKIEQTTADVWGKEIKKLVPYGINGGVGSGSETSNLPAVGGNNYTEFTLALKNLYGQIEITDKAIRASQNSVGAFVNLLNAEMEGLIKDLGINNLSADDMQACVKDPRIYQFIENRIRQVQKDMANFEQVRRFILLPEAFSMEKGELTNTLKAKRKVIINNHLEEIEALYEN